MVRDNDTIKFDDRSEVEDILNALNTYMQEHPNASEIKNVDRLCDLLDLMHIMW